MKLVTNAARRSQCRSRTGGPSLSLSDLSFLMPHSYIQDPRGRSLGILRMSA